MNQLLIKDKKILIVDDHSSIRHAISRVLQSMNFQSIYNSVSGESAINILEKEHIDLVLLDLYMPGKDGFDVLMHIRNRELRSDIPVIIVTGEGDKEEIVKAVDLGASEYMIKPFKTDDVERKVETALNNYTNPSEEVRLVRSAEELLLDGKQDEALKQILNARALKPENASIRHMHGLICLQNDDTDGARDILEQNVEDNPSYYKSYGLLAKIYFKLNMKEEAIEALGNELDLNPKQPGKQTSLGKIKLKLKDLEGAKYHFREALKELPKLESALVAMGHLFAKEDNLEKAIYYFKRARRHHPGSTSSLEFLVKYCLDHKAPVKAENILKDEKKTYPDRYDTYIILGKLYGSTKKIVEGIATMKDLIKKVPEHIEGLKLLAALYIRNGENQKSLVIYRQMFQLDPSIEIALKISDVCSRGTDFIEAITTLTQATKIDPHDGRIYFKMGELYFGSKEYTKAFYAYRTARKCGLRAEVIDNLIQECAKRTGMRRRSLHQQYQGPKKSA